VSAVIQIEKLTKIYEGAARGQDVHALKELDLTIDEGEILGYLGPNGSGKTTTIKMLLGLIFPTSGSIRIFGQTDVDSPSVKRNIGYLPEGAYYPDFLKGEEVLRFYGRLYGMSGKQLEMRMDEVLELVGMTHARKRLIRGYSKGMRQRIGLGQTLISDPKLMILDEPTTGLDPVARKEIRDLIVEMRSRGKTVMISSHELLEVELISDRVGILFEGELQTMGMIGDLLTDRDLVIEATGAKDEIVAKLTEQGITVEDRVGGRVRLRVPTDRDLYDAVELCKANALDIMNVSPRRETLEDLFVRIVGEAKAKRS
jgi:ABC-2 type transport system ATP-binding protein